MEKIKRLSGLPLKEGIAGKTIRDESGRMRYAPTEVIYP